MDEPRHMGMCSDTDPLKHCIMGVRIVNSQCMLRSVYVPIFMFLSVCVICCVVCGACCAKYRLKSDGLSSDHEKKGNTVEAKLSDILSVFDTFNIFMTHLAKEFSTEACIYMCVYCVCIVYCVLCVVYT